MTDREEFLGRPESGYLWCRECERAYRYDDFREEVLRVPDMKDVDGSILQVCHYPDCDGDTVFDAFDWDWLRGYHPMYPVVPVYGHVYPLNG